jgi:Ni,Fe-hydrogenase III large subunit
MSKNYKWLYDFIGALIAKQVVSSDCKIQVINPYPLLTINAAQWGNFADVAFAYKLRFAGIWAKELSDCLQVTACFELSGDHILARTEISLVEPLLSSITPHYAVAIRMERHIHDLFGVAFIDCLDKRRWIRHQAWTEKQFPLRKNFSNKDLQNGGATPPDLEYPFVSAKGSGIYEIPVGPVHAGIIEPGHFRFQAAGEDVLNLEIRLGYVHKGIEKIAEGRGIYGLLKLAGRVSGDATVAYTWSACKAFENAYDIKIPPRALLLRAIMVERERIANHLGDFAAICNDVGFAFAYFQFMRLKELWVRMNKDVFKHRFMMDCITADGVAIDIADISIDAMHKQIESFRGELNELYPMLENNSSLHDRLKTTGKLTLEVANSLGALGFVGRASGCKLDLRKDAPYAPYNQVKVNVPVLGGGDVLARIRIRAQEILESLDLLSQFLQNLPAGEVKTNLPEIRKAAEGCGFIEGWRGEILTYLSFDDNGLVNRYFPRDPSWFNWPALEELIHGNIVPDFPVCNKSINGSYSGVDL